MISQEDADKQAQADLLTNGQASANLNSTCIAVYYNNAISLAETSESCDAGYVGGTVTYTVPAGKYMSTVSQADADAQAQDEADVNAAWYANDSVHKACTLSTDPDWEELPADTSQEYCSSGDLYMLMTDLNPNSPTYNQTKSIDVGTSDKCPVPPFILYIDNGTGVYYDIELYNVASGAQYFYTSEGADLSIYNFPAGHYDIYITPYDDTPYTTYQPGCASEATGSGFDTVVFYSVELDPQCNSINIYY